MKPQPANQHAPNQQAPNQQALSRRLERVAAQVPAGARLADIGSDHAYLPVALLRRGAISRAVAGEVAATPFRAAQRTVQESGLGEAISVRLADGLSAIAPGDGITAISLCGMGGETIRDILEAGKARLSGQERLILQPNGGEQPLRHWLMNNGHPIIYEEVLREQRFDYEIIVAERSPGAGAVIYSDRELYFGPLLLQARSSAFVLKWERRLLLRQRALASLSKARQPSGQQQCEALAQEIRWITEILQ